MGKYSVTSHREAREPLAVRRKGWSFKGGGEELDLGQGCRGEEEGDEEM